MKTTILKFLQILNIQGDQKYMMFKMTKNMIHNEGVIIVYIYKDNYFKGVQSLGILNNRNDQKYQMSKMRG